jgi:hypothetical protein
MGDARSGITAPSGRAYIRAARGEEQEYSQTYHQETASVLNETHIAHPFLSHSRALFFVTFFKEHFQR